MNKLNGKVVFILNSISHPRCHKRITDFVNHGYDVKVYGIARDGFEIPFSKELYNTNIILTITEGNYLKRLWKMYKAISVVISQIQQNDTIYLFGLDVAIACLMHHKKTRYIYEESDLAHTYVNNKRVKWLLEKIDLKIIKQSFVTILTSEGFAQYHFGEKRPSNIFFVPNRLNPKIVELDTIEKRKIDITHLQFGFVGDIRYKSIYSFAEFIGEYYPQHTFHFYGTYNKKEIMLFVNLTQYPNIVFHGVFSNPTDLPSIYSTLDYVVSTYDTEFENVRFAEPNKIYEAIYFDTPIIVSERTYLADKVMKLGIGLSVDAMNEKALKHLIENISEKNTQEMVSNLQAIPKNTVLNQNSKFFNFLNKKFMKQ